MRWCDAQNDLRARQCRFKAASRGHVSGQAETGQVSIVLPGVGHASHQVGFMSPQPDCFKSRRQYDGKRCAPTSRTKNREMLQRRRPPKENTFSFPARIRSIFALWRITMNAPAMSAAASTGKDG